MACTLETLEEGPLRIRLVAHCETRAPDELFLDRVEPKRVHSWWGPEAKIDLRVGGEYVFRWTKINAVLRGRYVRIEPNHQLEFSWAWDDEPDRVKQVTLSIESDGWIATLLGVTHGPYSEDARDQELRQQHLDGWRFHLPKLDRSHTSNAPPTPD